MSRATRTSCLDICRSVSRTGATTWLPGRAWRAWALGGSPRRRIDGLGLCDPTLPPRHPFARPSLSRPLLPFDTPPVSSWRRSSKVDARYPGTTLLLFPVLIGLGTSLGSVAQAVSARRHRERKTQQNGRNSPALQTQTHRHEGWQEAGPRRRYRLSRLRARRVDH